MNDGLISFPHFLAMVFLGLIVGSIAHEGGHAICGALAGIRPRLVNIGLGRPLVRFNLAGTWITVRLGLFAAGWMLPEPSDRRWARFALVAGGPAGNLVLLAASIVIASAYTGTFAWLWPVGAVQIGGLIETLLPMKRTVAGSAAVTDGLALLRLLQRPPASLAKAYAGRLRPYLPESSPPSPPSRYAREILFETTRFDRWTEAWARRDALMHLRALLVRSDLVGPERACVATAIASLALAFGDSFVPPEQIDTLTRETLDFCFEPGPTALRGVALAFGGDLSAGHDLLLTAQQQFEDRRDPVCLEWVLCLAALGHVASMRGRSSPHAPELAALCERAAEGWFDIARKRAATLGPMAPKLIDRFDPPASAEDEPNRSVLRWLRGVEALAPFRAPASISL